MLNDYQAGRINLTAPYLLAYEQGSSLRAAARKRRITEGASRQALEAFFALRIPLVYDDDLLRRALELSVQFGAGYADSVYLAVSEASRIPFIHADQRLRNAISGRFRLELWIADYLSPL